MSKDITLRLNTLAEVARHYSESSSFRTSNPNGLPAPIDPLWENIESVCDDATMKISWMQVQIDSLFKERKELKDELDRLKADYKVEWEANDKMEEIISNLKKETNERN